MTIPGSMLVVETDGLGGPEVMRPGHRPVPEPHHGEVLIRVTAAGVNRPDCLQRRGLYPPPAGASDLLGLEVSGIVVALGEGVISPKLGASVCALVPGGGYAEYCVAAAGVCLPIPGPLDRIDAAGLPETLFTVWANVFDQADLQSGESLLVHGGGSGIGTTAIQLARAFGAKVYATAGNPEKCRACEKLGAVAIDYQTEDFAERIKTETRSRGVDVILDMVGGPYLNRNLDCLAPRGRLAIIAVQGGAKADINLAALMQRRLSLFGSTLRPRGVAEKAALAEQLRDKVWPLLESGVIAPVVAARFPLDQAADAHRLMESGTHIGKILLIVNPRS